MDTYWLSLGNVGGPTASMDSFGKVGGPADIKLFSIRGSICIQGLSASQIVVQLAQQAMDS